MNRFVRVAHRAHRHPHTQFGWSIVECVIALGLGLIVALMSSGLLLAANGNSRNHSDSQWLNDGGRYAMDIMAQAIRQSGGINWDSVATPPELNPDAPAAVAGLDASSISRGAAGISAPLPAVVQGSDVLALRFSGSGAGSNGDGASLNCAGFSVAAPATEDARGWSIFYVAADTGGEPELRCKYRGASGWGADAIVRGVESFQVLYGVDTDLPADGVPNVYLNAAAINTLDSALLPTELNRKTMWKHVCSIRIALLLHGESNTRADTVATQFDLFGAAYANAHGDDAGVRVLEASLPLSQRLRVRRLFSTTVALRNGSG